ncbi:MAG: 50S ribosomal protein L11 methyltransferase [Eubacteriales bacterium]|nr:50S ribosomal protein L11 methyltransferase [Eubacteriales bacterium]
MEKQWNKLTVHGARNDLDAICAVMTMIDEGLLIEDVSDLKINEMYGDLIDEAVLGADPDKISVSVFLSEDRNPMDCISFLRDRFVATEMNDRVKIEVEGIREEDWSETWKKYYHPVKLGRITVVPAWEDYTPADGEIIVRMDPGMAFGTGTHETTRLVIRMLEETVKGSERVLDIGTGSGILSLCASKLGASFCAAYDIDPDAVKVARENIEKDGAKNVTVGVSDLLSGVDLSAGKFDLVVANIVADIVLRLFPDLSDCMTEDGMAILSGIIDQRLPEIKKKMKECGFVCEREMHENDWCALLVKRG